MRLLDVGKLHSHALTRSHSFVDSAVLRLRRCCVISPLLLTSFVAARASDPSWNYDQLKDLITSNGIHSRVDLMARLPPHLRERFALAYESQSLQTATPLCPRILLFENDASLILAFSGKDTGLTCGTSPSDASTKDSDHSVEVIQFEEPTRRFSFHEIKFVEGQDQLPQFEDHPSQCIKCHRSDPRPNWDIYFAWPRFYGGVDDGILPNSVEGSNYRAFVEENSSKGLYSYLQDYASLELRNPSGNLPEKFKYYFVHTRPESAEFVSGDPFDKAQAYANSRMNLKIGFQLSKLNFKRLARKVAESVKDRKKINQVLYALLWCPDFSSVLAEGELTDYLRNHDQLVNEIKEQNLAATRRKAERLAAQTPLPVYLANGRREEEPLANLRFLLQGILSMDEWAMPFDGSHFSFETGGDYAINGMAPEIIRVLNLSGEPFQSLLKAPLPWNHGFDAHCRELRERIAQP